jgi:hypothetical protein
MPRPDLGPALAELQVDGDGIVLLRTIRICTEEARPCRACRWLAPSMPKPSPPFDLAGAALPADPGGADSEGLIALSDGGFWVGDEYGPSLLRLNGEGRLTHRWFPVGCAEAGEAVLPALAGRRQINRGSEAIAVSPDEKRLWLASRARSRTRMQRRTRRHATSASGSWTRPAGAVNAQFSLPAGRTESFRRDSEKGAFKREDIKVSEILYSGEDRLLVLERGFETTKLYFVTLDPRWRSARSIWTSRPGRRWKNSAAGRALPRFPC